MKMFTLFVCNDMEAAWIAQLCADGEREMAEWERLEDLEHEERLAREAVEDDETDAWPAYADAPLEVEDPDVIEDADLLGLPVTGPQDDFDDERAVAAGYTIVANVLDAVNFGVPQRRRRAFVVGTRDGAAFQFPMPATWSFGAGPGVERWSFLDRDDKYADELRRTKNGQQSLFADDPEPDDHRR